jgi:CRISPR-associated protein Csd1
VPSPLTPLYHTLNNTQIEVRITGEGDFIGATLEELKNTIIPCTEKSAAARVNNPPPHPLCDKIQFCAKDYKGEKRSYFSKYIELLEKWASSEPKHAKVNAIYKYVQKGTLLTDLINTQKQIINDKEDPGDLFVRWKVEIPDEYEVRCWKDNSLFENWRHFCESQEKHEDICMVTGEKTAIAINHPKRIRNGKDGAKLISSNDNDGFTFRGRFLSADQSATISSEVSHKAHSALRWLISRQGFINFDQVIISWAISGKKTPDPLSDSISLFEDSDEERINEINHIQFNDIGQTFAKKLNKKIAGYHSYLGNSTNIVVMGLDSANPGRLSITFYRELTDSEFLNRVKIWHKQMAWLFLDFIQDPFEKKKRHHGYIASAPAPAIIAEACYGTKRDKDFIKFKKSMIERLLPCIIDSKPIPIDIVELAVRKASNRLGYKEDEHWQWERTLSVACALYRCHSIRNLNNTNKNEYTMALENERTDRDYLYGRLLAVAEHIEETALRIAKENRDTTASRLMQRFSDYPFSTWRSIELALKPYESRILSAKWGPGFLVNKRKLIDEIHSKFESVEDYKKDSRLSGLYLLGYHCQRLELKAKKQDEENELENNK